MIDRHHFWLLLAVVVIIGGALLLYRAALFARILINAGSGAVAVVVMAHLGVLAALVAPFAILRRRSRGRKM
jgi:uncharacterized membrane protein YhaH (DUF805 family)